MHAESEWSLPMESAHIMRSSPPAATQYSLPPMDGSAKSEPAAPQEVQQIQDVQQTPRRSRHKRANSDDTERPAPAQHDRPDGTEEHFDVEGDQDVSDDEDADPAQQILEFDWDQLHEEYHNAINQCSQEETELMEEWSGLMEYFRIWAASGHERETDRTFQRLQTRTMYVKNKEDELERTRTHYINVVRAFESALNLLKNNGMQFRG